jgi:hypothetical protein
MKKSKRSRTARAAKGRDLNLPTEERMRRGDIVVRNSRAHAEHPLRIDKLFAGSIIDEMQHLYGMQIITLWTIASRPFIKAVQYEHKTSSSAPDLEYINLSRMGAEDQFYKTMGYLRPREHELICRICFKEQGAIEAGRAMGLAINGITSYVRDAFDALGDALAKMRELKRGLEKRHESEPA